MIMKLHLDQSNATYQIQRYESHSVTINDKTYSQSIIVMPEYLSQWGVTHFEQLQVAHFQRLVALRPQLVLLGTGPTLRFPTTPLLAPLINEGIGVEVMTTPAACRTYMILLLEGRNVAMALLFE
jgi:uncharacterized protein